MQKVIKSISILLFLYLGFFINARAQRNDSTSVQLADSARYKADSISRANGAKISGVIKDAATGKPVSGVSISVPEYAGAITDERGAFTVSIPNNDAVLILRGQGYHQKDVAIRGRTTLPDILLYEESYSSVYDQARMPFSLVTASKQPSSVSNINTLGAWEPVSTEMPDTYLQGRVAGLNIVRRSGTPNIGANIFLRGFNSITATNAPLVVVDGMIYDTNHYGNSLINGFINNPFSNLDLRDVDNYTILKDAAAGIYGTKGANGAILISTNNSPNLATKIDFGIYSGYNFLPQKSLLPIMEAADYRTYLSNVLQTSGQTADQIAAMPYMNDNTSNPQYFTYHNDTDWQKQAFKSGFNNNYNLRVSGGDNVARYALSLGYGKGKGITDMTDFSKYSTRFNGNLNISKKFTITTNLSFTYNEQNLRDQGDAPKTNPIFVSLIKPPLLRRNVVNSQGVESPNLDESDIFGISNPAALTEDAQERHQNYRFFGNFNFKYQFNRYFAAQTLFGVTTDKIRENTFIPKEGVSQDTVATGSGTSIIADSRLASQTQRLFNVYSDTYVSYNRTFSRIHKLGLYLGTRYTQSNSTFIRSSSYNSSIDELVSVGNGLTGRSTGGDVGLYRWMNNYLNANYELNNKYIFGFTLAADASSRFGNQVSSAVKLGGISLAVLPSVSAAWVISSEKFMGQIKSLELLKLRASYGLTGNDDIGNYSTRQYYTTQSLLGLQGLVVSNFANPTLQWEVGKKFDIGLDASFLQERLNITADYFKNTTSKMLVQESAPSVSGTSSVLSNNGGMETDGVEFSLNTRIISKTNLKWDVGFNISTYRNKITKVPGDRMLTQYAGATILTEVGMPANVFYGYKTNGVYSSNAEASAAGIGYRNSAGNVLPQQGGDMKFIDVNGDKVIDANDRQVLGNANPSFTGGITTGLTYKHFSLNALLSFSQGNEVYNYTRRQLESQSNARNQTLATLNRWRADGQVTTTPRASFGDPTGNSSFSDRWIEDGSYMRLRTLSLSYDLPLNRKILKYLRVYATGNNLFTFTKYLGYDPEFSAGESVLIQGIDNTMEPQYKTVQLGLRVGI